RRALRLYRWLSGGGGGSGRRMGRRFRLGLHLYAARLRRGGRRRRGELIQIRRLQSGVLGVFGLPDLAGGFRLCGGALLTAPEPFSHAALLTQNLRRRQFSVDAAGSLARSWTLRSAATLKAS